ncbi:MAG: AAA family ATPase [Leptospiraceae bacterium]|nr:AAA family ATPase [Leptospiraceae bacterium]
MNTENHSFQINKLNIQNFKSIKNLSIEPKRVNVFIGEPASGKSNIIEAISLLSKRTVPIKDMIRMREYNDLIYNKDDELEVKVEVNDASFVMKYVNGNYKVTVNDSITNTEYQHLSSDIKFFSKLNKEVPQLIKDFDEKFGEIQNLISENGYLDYRIDKQDRYDFTEKYFRKNIYFYKFKFQNEFSSLVTDSLNAPFGENLPQVIITKGSLRQTIKEIFKNFNFTLSFNTKENTIKIFQNLDSLVTELPFINLSDSLQRLVFYVTAMHTKESILLFEEPESHVFPFYNKYFGERIGLDEENQYFIATHNFPFLCSIMQKTNPKDLQVYIIYSEDNQTKVSPIEESKFSDVYDMEDSFFLNLDRFKK